MSHPTGRQHNPDIRITNHLQQVRSPHKQLTLRAKLNLPFMQINCVRMKDSVKIQEQQHSHTSPNNVNTLIRDNRVHSAFSPIFKKQKQHLLLVIIKQKPISPQRKQQSNA
tara:strand:- start:2762 stop:3094 length:333 start_codon:yes stop_codon:yes gene_type:complete